MVNILCTRDELPWLHITKVHSCLKMYCTYHLHYTLLLKRGQSIQIEGGTCTLHVCMYLCKLCEQLKQFWFSTEAHEINFTFTFFKFICYIMLLLSKFAYYELQAQLVELYISSLYLEWEVLQTSFSLIYFFSQLHLFLNKWKRWAIRSKINCV